MSSVDGKVALQLVKGGSKFVDAILGPKIDRVKAWSKEKDLEGQINPENISKIMRGYILKLSERVSEITSISFPLMKLNIFDAYEPLLLEKLKYDSGTEEIQINHLINENSESFLIIDSAGMGKSTFAKYIVASLLYKSNRIPLFFELRKVNKNIDLIDNLAKELDVYGDCFSRDLFYKLLQTGKFYVILDGYDEIDIEHQEEVAEQVKELSLKGGENIILLTSRPQEIIPEIINSVTLRFKSFTKEQALSMLSRYDKVSGCSVGKELSAQIDKVPEKFIESPLLVSLLYKTFGVNKSIAEKTCTFYEEIYHALYKGHDLVNKNGYGRMKKSGLDFEDFRTLLRAMCYIMMLTRKYYFKNWSDAISIIKKATEITSIEPKSASKYLDDLLVSVPLAYKDGHEIKFFHKTILEFFAAEYVLFHKNSFELLKKLFDSKYCGSFSKCFEFLYELNSSLFDSVITSHYAKEINRITYDPKNLLEAAFYSLMLRRDTKVGIWDVEMHGERDKNGHLGFVDSDVLLLGSGFNTCRYFIYNVNGKSFFFAFNYTELDARFHTSAWNALTIPYDGLQREESASKLEEYGDEILGILGENCWVDLDDELVQKLKKFNPLKSIILRIVCENGRYRVLSRERAKLILEKIDKEDDFAIETDSFL